MARPLHLYVHVPFCARKCPYCHFYNLGHDDAREAVYLDALARELAACRVEGAFDGTRLVTLYWGGGTPSLLTPEGFERLADLCLGVAPRGETFEWTVEVNPADATEERFAAFQARGVTRLSVGVQSFDDERLAFLGRNHTGEQARGAVARAGGAGFADVSLDLMFNLAVPVDGTARRRAWAHDLATAFALPITHLSLYGLTLEPGTAFHARAAAGAALTIPDAAAAAEYRAACRAARRAGFEHYEVSAFARAGHRARHNAAYWTGASYLGVGPAAHSYDGLRRWANVASLTGWADAQATGGDGRAFVEWIGPRERLLESLYLGLRTQAGVARDHPLISGAAAGGLVAGVLADGLCELRDDRLACTERGFLVLDGLLDRFAALADPAPGAIDTLGRAG